MVAVSLLLVAVLTVLSLNVFGGGGGAVGGGGGAAGTGAGTGAGTATGTGAIGQSPSILSRSRAEQQIQLCVEGRDSSYGDPPSSAQQAQCVRDLAGQISGDGSSLPDAP
jgi:hypothetical protein